MTATAYPLSWPQNMPRSRSRETGKFKTSLRALGVAYGRRRSTQRSER